MLPAYCTSCPKSCVALLCIIDKIKLLRWFQLILVDIEQTPFALQKSQERKPSSSVPLDISIPGCSAATASYHTYTSPTDESFLYLTFAHGDFNPGLKTFSAASRRKRSCTKAGFIVGLVLQFLLMTSQFLSTDVCGNAMYP